MPAGGGRVVLVIDGVAVGIDRHALVGNEHLARQSARPLNGEHIPGDGTEGDDDDAQDEHIPKRGAAAALLTQLLTPADLGGRRVIFARLSSGAFSQESLQAMNWRGRNA